MMFISTLTTIINQWRNAGKQHRQLEIGPGEFPIAGFETLNIVSGRYVDYVCNAAEKLPFPDHTFELIYCSHILEHIPWYLAERTLAEWKRVLKPGGSLEIWVPDGYKICKTLIEYEDTGVNSTAQDGWYRWNEDHDPCRWAAGRLFTYGDGTGKLDHPNWHRALYTPRFLEKILQAVGYVDVRRLAATEVRGADHGWINLGMTGKKP